MASLEERQAAMRARMEKQRSVEKVEAHPKCQMPGCHRFARKGQPYCSRCTVKGFQEKLRDTLPGMETGGSREAVELEQNKAGNVPEQDTVLATPSLSDEHLPVANQPQIEIPKQYTRKDVSKLVGVSMTTLMRWEKKGVVTPRHIAYGNKYIYTEEQLEVVRKYKEMEIPVGYSQSSSTDKAKPGTLDDFARQRKGKMAAGKKVEKTVSRTLHNLGSRLM